MKAWLELQGFDAPFLDIDKHSGIPPGADWEKTLYREIEHSQALLILQSANWNASKWCDREFTCARFLGKPIFQLIESGDGDAGQPIAPELQVLDLRQEREAGLEQLKKQLEAIALSAQGGFPWDGTRAPYPGLLAFEEEDAPIYFGRDDEISHLIERLRARRTLGGARLLVLLGASGSGKSSLLRAGVLPRLRRSGRAWLVVPPFRPQSQPCQELARALAFAAGRGAHWSDLHRSLLEGDRSGTLPAVLASIASDLRMAAAANEAQILLSIDQGEELFGGLEPEEANRFFRILTAAMGGDLPFLAVMTLRSEFLGRLQAAEKEGLSARFEEVSLAPMPMAQIPAIIKGPAKVAGVDVEEAFVQQAAADAETEDALPLLAFALRELYERFGADLHLSLADYEALGDAKDDLSPLENAVRLRADEVLAAMHPSEQQKRALRDAFVPAMVRFEQGNYVRRPARWDALPTEAQPLLQELVNARLLISREEEGHRLLEVAHEALLRKWPLLRDWLDEDREFLIGSQQLEQDLLDWKRAGEQERPAALLSGLKLHRARYWLSERPQQLGDDLRDFIQASINQAEAQERKARRNRRRVISGLSGLTALAIAGGAIALWRERAAQAAQIEQYAANHLALLTSNPLESLVNGLAAADNIRSNPGAAFQLSDTLAQAVEKNHERQAILIGQEAVQMLVALPNGVLISAGEGGNIKRWSMDGKQIGKVIPTGQRNIFTIVVLPTGGLLIAGQETSSDGKQVTTIKLWGTDGKQIGRPLFTAQSKFSLLESVWAKTPLPSGDLLSSGLDGRIKRWDKNFNIVSMINAGKSGVSSLLVLPNGEFISGDLEGIVKRWSKDAKVVSSISTGHDGIDSLLTFPNGDLVTVGGLDAGTVKRWGKDSKQIGPTITPHTKIIYAAGISDDELAIAEGSILRRWARIGTALEPIHTGQGSVRTLVSSADSGDLFSGGTDGSVKSWSMGGPALDTISTGQGSVISLVALHHGEIATAGADGSIKRWGKDGSQIGRTILTGKDRVISLVSLPNGEMGSAGADGSIKRWGSDGNQIGNTIHTGQGRISLLVAFPNGEIASSGDEGSIKRWGKDGKQVGQTIQTGEGSMSSLIALPNGEMLSGELVIRRWSREGQEIGSAINAEQGLVESMVALPNGELLSGGLGGTVKRWDKRGKQIGSSIAIDQGMGVKSIIALTNGEFLSIGGDGTINRWGKDGKAFGSVLTGQGEIISLVALTNGEIVSAGANAKIKRWSLEEVAKRGCLDLKYHSVLRNPKTPPQRAARATCRRLGILKE